MCSGPLRPVWTAESDSASSVLVWGNSSASKKAALSRCENSPARTPDIHSRARLDPADGPRACVLGGLVLWVSRERVWA